MLMPLLALSVLAAEPTALSVRGAKIWESSFCWKDVSTQNAFRVDSYITDDFLSGPISNYDDGNFRRVSAKIDYRQRSIEWWASVPDRFGRARLTDLMYATVDGEVSAAYLLARGPNARMLRKRLYKDLGQPAQGFSITDDEAVKRIGSWMTTSGTMMVWEGFKHQVFGYYERVDEEDLFVVWFMRRQRYCGFSEEPWTEGR